MNHPEPEDGQSLNEYWRNRHAHGAVMRKRRREKRRDELAKRAADYGLAYRLLQDATIARVWYAYSNEHGAPAAVDWNLSNGQVRRRLGIGPLGVWDGWAATLADVALHLHGATPR